MDTFTPAERSAVMRRVRGKDTQPEMAVRSMVHRLGFRYALHRRDLPGNPDLVFPARDRVIFVHGCFWHGHSCRAGRNRPSSNSAYWTAKLDRNRARDAKTLAAWCANLDANWEKAVHEVGMGTARVWRLYMAGSQLGFDRNVVQLHQVLGVKLHADGSSGMPLRPDWEPAQAGAKASA